MRLLLRCAVFSTIFTLVMAALILLSVGWASKVAFWSLYPALRLGTALFERLLDFDSGATSFVGAIVLSIPLSIALYTGVGFLLFKIGYVLRRTRHGEKMQSSN